MKKQLLTALLAITPFFAFSNEEISKTELLAHLKNVKADILYILYNNEKSIKAIKNRYVDWDGFKQMINIWNDLINTMDPVQKQVTIDAETCFNLICQKQENLISDLDCIITKISKIMDSENKNLSDPEIKKNYTLVFSTLAKHLRYPWYNYFNDYLKDPYLEKEINNISAIGDFFCMGYFIYEIRIFKKLLPMLDAKIENLKMQI